MSNTDDVTVDNRLLNDYKVETKVQGNLEHRQVVEVGSTSDDAKISYITDPNTGEQAAINEDGQLHVVAEGHLCSGNSTTALLLADAVFTGVSRDILAYNAISVFVTSDVASATNGLQIQYSADGSTNWRTAESYTILAGAEKWFSPPAFGKYFRVVYTNGGTGQASFELTTILRKVPFKWSSHNIDEAITDQDDAELVKSVLAGKNPGGDFINFGATNGGNFKISLEEFEEQVSTNSNTQLKTTLYDEDGIPASVDDTTETLQVVSYEHHEIHAGNHYNYCDYSLGEAAASEIEFVMTTPNTTSWVHLTFAVSSSNGATIELYEGASGVTGGTTIIPRNNQRNSSNTSTVTLVKDPISITSDGTRASGYVAGGARASGIISREREIVLAQNEVYLVRITSLAVNNDISWCAEWYEHVNKN